MSGRVADGGAPACRKVVEAGVEAVSCGTPLVLFDEDRVLVGVLDGGGDEALGEGCEGGGAGGICLHVGGAKLDGAEPRVRPDVPPAQGVVRDAAGSHQGLTVALEVLPGAKPGW